MSQSAAPFEPYHNTDLFSSYYLDERIGGLDAWDCDEEAEEAFEQLRDLWELEKDLVDSYNEDELLDSWIDDVLDILGFGTLSETTLPDGSGYNDRLLFDSHEARRDAALRRKDGDSEAMYNLASALLEAKQWDSDFTKRFSEERSYWNASQQTKFYLEHTPERLNWGILTDGQHWRLYGTKNYATETYYEVDLPKLLESGDVEQFKYFYTFFRPAAFREIAGTSYLDTVWNESETAAQELGEDLQDNVFTALRVLGEGFIETNDLDLDPDDEAARDELKQQSLVLLYRLMFVLYAEAEGLIHPDDPDAEDEYQAEFALEKLRLDIHDDIQSGDSFEDYSAYSTSIWNRLQDLFRLVDRGEESLGIPPYNGGLFDSEQHSFLAKNQVANRYIAEVVYRLATTKNEEGSFVLADYADLDTRHLGTIYEGLLEHQFRIAPEQYAAVSEDGSQVWKPATEVSVADAVEIVDEGELYVVNDEGERKATGAYYTPDYVVTYIVEETVDPLIEEIDDDLKEKGLEQSDREYFAQFWQRVLDLKILDPAMGSGHFLTRATGYLTERVMEVVREQEIQSYDEQDLRRAIAKECIYGVDVNRMAVELAKLSMWLETLAADQPLAFLDHHLKPGNSLVGSDISAVLSSGGADETDGMVSGGEDNGTVQSTFDYFEQVRRRALDHVMDQMSKLLSIENETLEEIHSMEAIYDEIRADSLYVRLQAMATVHTASEFGLDVPEDAIERMARAIEDDEEWAALEATDWFRAARAMADEEGFFHWELEFPAVFFDMDGDRLASAGFDAVVGNPPWMDFQRIDQQERRYQRESFKAAVGKYDMYAVFAERATNSLSEMGEFGFVIQNRFLSSSYGTGLKKHLAENFGVRAILDFEDANVFEGTTTYPLILLASASQRREFQYAHLEDASAQEVEAFLNGNTEDSHLIQTEKLIPDRPWIFPTAGEQSVMESIRESDSTPLNELTEDISTGMKTNLKDAYVFESPRSEIPVEDELLRPVLDGGDIYRYSSIEIQKFILYPYVSNPDGTLRPIELDSYPKTEAHFFEYESELRERLFYEKTVEEMGKKWFEFPYSSENLLAPKILFPDISREPRATFDSAGDSLILNTAYGAVLSNSIEIDVRFVCALFNSAVLRFAFTTLSPKLSGGYYRFQTQYVGQLPIIDIPEVENSSIDELKQAYRDGIAEKSDYGIEVDEIVTEYAELGNQNSQTHDFIGYLADEMVNVRKQRSGVNLDLLDYLGTYEDGSTLGERYQPASGLAESVLTDTEADSEFEKLRVTGAQVKRDGDRLRVLAAPYVKPTDADEYDTNSHGYAMLDPVPVMEFVGLDDTQAALIEAFVPYAVDEAGGFANYRDNATATISPLDRLESLTLPELTDVESGIENYVEKRKRAEELDEKIERTDELIDEIVYELYGLTDEEIEIVEDAVGD